MDFSKKELKLLQTQDPDLLVHHYVSPRVSTSSSDKVAKRAIYKNYIRHTRLTFLLYISLAKSV